MQHAEHQTAHNLRDIENIKGDVFNNIDNILLQMEIKPFEVIVSRYMSKV